MKTCKYCGLKWIREDLVVCTQCHRTLHPIFGSRINEDHLCPICFNTEINENEDGSFTCSKCEHKFWVKVDDPVGFPHSVIWPARGPEEFYRFTNWFIPPPLTEIILVFTLVDPERFPEQNHGHHHMDWVDYWYLVSAIGPVEVWTGCWHGRPARCLHPGMFYPEKNDERVIVASTHPGYTIDPEALLKSFTLPRIFEIVGYQLNDTHDVMDITIRLLRDLISDNRPPRRRPR